MDEYCKAAGVKSHKQLSRSITVSDEGFISEDGAIIVDAKISEELGFLKPEEVQDKGRDTDLWYPHWIFVRKLINY